MERIATARPVIVGAGLGGLYAALALAPRPALVISPEPLGEGASSAWAQGGVAAALAPPDAPEVHAADTCRAGAGLVDPAVAAAAAAEARGHVEALVRLGAPFDRTPDGGYVLSREAAHSFARVARIGGDGAGAGIMRALVARVRETPSIQVLEGAEATGLRVSAGRVTGVEIAPARPGGPGPAAIEAPAVLLAAGGAGGLFALTTNPARIRGQAMGMAALAGAAIADAEFVQFHPTALDVGFDPAPLATEALRGEGAILVDRAGRRILEGLHPDLELAPRDVVARAVYACAQAGGRPMLDARAAVGARIERAFPAVAAACRRAGIDPVREPIPVAAAAHYHMGGIETDAAGRSSLPGLWACGEAASTGLHGANRLASNGLLEALVFGARCARDIDAALGPAGPAPEVAVPRGGALPAPDPALIARLRRAMTDGAGVVRDAPGLRRTLREIARIEAEAPACAALRPMTAAATLIAAAALLRPESRGAHFRAERPAPPPGEGRRSRLTLDRAREIREAALLETAR
ncbi:L-aspartate oxidase [Albimonas sp. CAU 1670]|uniref:L-aspartate oxidase n=1 Tax=Albimonas sp. CAU 1670 TaxID=3032599 RepID=UPI0023DA0E06|nr:L-aspartate oxidase [Albimonas sp. CAU 1670]MDF2233023.1 L-aspartate oxidase [Albimonas sp. CAU 1670]